jgi:hypothetical protein
MIERKFKEDFGLILDRTYTEILGGFNWCFFRGYGLGKK